MLANQIECAFDSLCGVYVNAPEENKLLLVASQVYEIECAV